MKIERISLQISNCYLITDKKKILVDCGCQGDWVVLRNDLISRGVRISELSAVVLTHVHFDHCGCAAYLQAEGVPVIASVLAASPLALGYQEGKSLLQRAAKLPWLGDLMKEQRRFPAVAVDVAVETQLDLTPFGVEGEIVCSGGHTEASVSVVLSNRTACVGDLVMGGFLGLPPAWKPHYHPLSINNEQALRQIISFRDSGIEHFCVGHGDILAARDVDRWIESELKSAKK
jgi:glyoxylase-like metal-dependent hydrolase (beta-lactamase superfamily II)